MMWSGHVLNMLEIPSMSTLSASLRKIWSKLNEVCWWHRLFKQSRGWYSKINDLLWTVFELIWDFINVPLICKFQEALIKTKQVMLMTKSNRGFFSCQGKVTLRLMIRSDQFLQLIRDFIHVHLMSEFQEDLIKNESVVLMTKSNRGFFSNQGN